MAAGFLRKARAPRRREFRGRCVEQPEWEERPGRNTGWRWRRARPFSSPIGALENERNAAQAKAVCDECEVIVEQVVATHDSGTHEIVTRASRREHGTKRNFLRCLHGRHE